MVDIFSIKMILFQFWLKFLLIIRVNKTKLSYLDFITLNIKIKLSEMT